MRSHFLVSIYNDATLFLKDYQPQARGCILLDLLMPKMNGFELLQELNQRNNPLPIFVLSGNGDLTTKEKVLNAGAKEFITKPINCMDLLNKIEALFKENP